VIDHLAEFRLMQSLRDEPACRGCGVDKGRLVLCRDCWIEFTGDKLPLDQWVAEQECTEVI
jgi:hypothetical protein